MKTADDPHMGPLNASVRFLAELIAVYGIAVGVWEWTGSIFLAVTVPLVAAVAWGVFRVPDDPGPAPVAVPGWTRLLLEAVVFGVGAAGLWIARGAPAGVGFSIVMGMHYATTPRRLVHVLAARRSSS